LGLKRLSGNEERADTLGRHILDTGWHIVSSQEVRQGSDRGRVSLDRLQHRRSYDDGGTAEAI
jgi:hypothetical protein